jgi:hypothetical protein
MLLPVLFLYFRYEPLSMRGTELSMGPPFQLGSHDSPPSHHPCAPSDLALALAKMS